VLGALIGIALAAVGLGAILAADSASDGEAVPDGWSSWRPVTAGDPPATAQEIAAHVGPRYRLGNSNQLVAVRATPMELQGRPLSVAMTTAATGGNIELIEGDGLIYTLTGLGPNGSILGGTPSAERLLLLRREALELALYTFHYADDVDMVVALLPPPPPEKGEEPAEGQAGLTPVQALFFRPGDLEGQLAVPLDETIPPRTPLPEQFAATRNPDAQRVDALTRANVFTATFTQTQDASLYLVLHRPPATP
jgi:hypothetical protein